MPPSVKTYLDFKIYTMVVTVVVLPAIPHSTIANHYSTQLVGVLIQGSSAFASVLSSLSVDLIMALHAILYIVDYMIMTMENL